MFLFLCYFLSKSNFGPRLLLYRSSINKIKFENTFTIVDEILSCQRSLSDKIGIGYNKGKQVVEEQSSEGNIKGYVDVLKNSIKIEDNRKESQDRPKKTHYPYQNKFKKTFPPRWNYSIRYQNYFLAIIILAMVLVINLYSVEEMQKEEMYMVSQRKVTTHFPS